MCKTNTLSPRDFLQITLQNSKHFIDLLILKDDLKILFLKMALISHSCSLPAALRSNLQIFLLMFNSVLEWYQHLGKKQLKSISSFTCNVLVVSLQEHTCTRTTTAVIWSFLCVWCFSVYLSDQVIKDFIDVDLWFRWGFQESTEINITQWLDKLSKGLQQYVLNKMTAISLYKLSHSNRMKN